MNYNAGNWQEDRDQAPVGDTANRVVITDPQFGGYSTSASAIGGTDPDVRRASNEMRKTMMSGVNFHEIHTKRDSRAPTSGTYNSTLPAHPPTEFATYRETTYGKFFEADPADSKANQAPPPEQGDDTRFRGGYPASCNPVRPEEPMYSTSRAGGTTNRSRAHAQHLYLPPPRFIIYQPPPPSLDTVFKGASHHHPMFDRPARVLF